MSNSVRPHRQQPTRLPCPWDSSGKNTGVGCHFLLQCMKVKSESEVTQSCPTLHDPIDCSLAGSSIHGIFQARVLEWGAILLFSSISLHWLLRKAFLSLLAILWNSGYVVWNGIQKPFLQGDMKEVKYSEIKMVQNDRKWYWHKRNNSPEMKGSMAVIMVRYRRELMLTESRGFSWQG